MIDLLKASRFFRDFTDEELEAISKIGQLVSLKAGERIFEAESPAEYFYIISEGAVEIRFELTYYNVTKEITLERRVKGDAFGSSALTKPNVYTLSAWTAQDTKLLKFKASEINKICHENAHFGFIMMNNISEIIGERFASIQRILIDVIQQSLKDKEV
ncbi:MAG: Crp/Fnr family transcriptional regulator [bacterium]